MTSNPPALMVGAGDIAKCDDTHDEETAGLLDAIPGTVFAAGDIAYDDGTITEFNDCYDPSWGRHKARTRPVPGNHEYDSPNAAGYYEYFGAAAGVAQKGFYSYDLGDWHVVALNNYISMDPTSEQGTWLQADLAATTKPCRLAYYHEPLYSSATGTGSGGTSTASVRPLFTALYNAGVDVILNGHRHFYERLSPMNPQGQLDTDQGIRQFIVGTGGASIANPTNAHPLSELRFGSSNHGVLKLYLYSDSYAWRFVPVPGKTLSDTGSYACHGFGSGVSASQSSVVAVPGVISLGGTSTITVTVLNGTGQKLAGATVQLAVSPTAGVTLTQPTGPTDANGVATGTLSSTVLGDKVVTATVTLSEQSTVLNQSATVSVAAPSVITHTLLTAGTNTVNQKVYTTASITPVANSLVLLAVLGRQANGTSPSPVVTGGGMASWTVVGTLAFDALGAPTRRVTVYRAMSATPGSGPLTIRFSGTQGNAQWIVSQWNGVDQTGTNGAGAIVQTGTAGSDGATGLNVTLNPFESPSNVAYGAFGVSRTTAVVNPGFGFTEIAEQPSGESTPGDLQAEWRTNDNTVDASWGSLSLTAGAVAVEIKSSSAGTAGIVDALQSTVEVSPGTIMAGAPTATVTVTARDANGVPVSGATVQLATTGTGNTVSTPDPTNSNGVATATLSSTVAETKTISATANGTSLTQHVSVQVTAGAVSPTQSTVTAQPTTIAPGGQVSSIMVTVKDQFGNPVNNASVALSAAPPAGVTLTQPGNTDAGGVTSGELSSAIAETKTVSASVTVGSVTTPLNQTAGITITPQGSSVIVQTLLTAGNNPANLKVYTTASIAPAPNALVTVAVLGRQANGASPSPLVTGGGMASWTEVTSATFDPLGAPTRRVSIYRAMSAAPGSGPLTIRFTGTQGNAQWIVSQWTGVDESGTNGSGAIVQTGTANGDAVTGLDVTLSSFANASDVAYGAFGVTRNTAVVTPGAGFTEISEQPSAESTPGDLQTEWRTNDNTVDASWVFNLNSAAAALEIRAGASGSGSAVDPDQATFEVSPPVITPGGAGAGIEVIVRDAGGVPLAGVVVTLFSTGTGNTLSAPGPTDATGKYHGTLSSTKAETKVVTATARLGTVTTTLNGSAVVTVEPGPVSPSQSSLSADPVTIDAGSGSSTITVVVHDAQLNPIAGANVALSASGSGNTLSAPGLTNAGGVFVGTLSSTVPEDKTVSAAVTVGGVVTQITQTAAVTVEAGGVSGTLSSIGASPLIIPAASGSSAITVTVKNGAGQPVEGATVQLSATGSGNTLSAPGVTNESGVYTGSLSSTVAGDKVVSASATEEGTTTPLSATVTVTVEPGPVSGTQSGLAADPLSIAAGTGSSAITVTIRDANDNPIPGASVALSASGSGNTLSAPALTNASGIYTGSVSSTVVGEKVVFASATVGDVTTPVSATATVTVTPGAVSSTQSVLSADVTSISADGGGTATITVTVLDADLNPISGATVTLAATGAGHTLSAPGLTDANGVYSGTLSSTAAGDKVVSASASVSGETTALTQTATIAVLHGALSATQSSLTADATVIETELGSATITVTAHDSHGNPIPGATVALSATGTGNTLSAPGTTNAAGAYVGSLSSTDPGDKIVSATVTIDGTSTELAATTTVSVQRLASATLSTIDASPATIDAATGTSTITVTVHDGQGQPVAGASVELLASGSGNTVAPAGETDASGVYTGTVSSTVAETKTISASVTYNTIVTLLSPTAQVTVTPGPISTDHSTLAAAPTSITRETGTSTITVTVRDEHDNPIAGAGVALSATGTGNTLSAAGVTNASGVYTGSLSSTDVGDKVVSASATVDGATTALTATATVTVEAGPVSTAQSTVAADPSALTAGVGSSTITVTVLDAAGNPISGATVTLSATGSGNTLSAPGLTDASGVFVGSLSSSVAGEKGVSASVTRGASTTDLTATASVTVAPGPVSATQALLTATPASIALETGTATITVTVHDALNNPIPGVTVTLFATGGGNTLSAPGVTDASGVYSGTLSSTVAEDKVISASATQGGTTTELSPTATVTVVPQVATIGHTLLTSGTNAVNLRNYTTASISPAPNTLVTLAVLGRNPSGVSPDPIVTGGGMTTWEVVSSSTFDPVGLPTRRVTVYRAMSATPGSGPITITFAAAQGNAQWIVSQWDGVETDGTNGSAAIVQSGTANGDAVTGLAVGLAPFAHANNVAYGAFGVAKNVAWVTPGAGFTEIAEEASGETTPGDLQAEWAVNLNPVAASWAEVNGAAVGIEIKARVTTGLPSGVAKLP